jgi:hypothetical protein
MAKEVIVIGSPDQLGFAFATFIDSSFVGLIIGFGEPSETTMS